MTAQDHLEFEGVDPILSKLPRDPAGGYRIGSCRLEKVIGHGGMGRVYRGRHNNLDVPVAVKCLYVSNISSSPRLALDRFKREAKLAAMVSHENLIRVYDSGEDHGIHYIVMELVEGETARARVDRKGKLELFEALAIIHGTIKALRAAHERQLIHRDIKPGNILISREAKIKLADLGLAKSLESSALDLTMKGSKLGTPRYAAPEQWQDASEVTPATDVYAIGAVIYFFLTGEDGIQGDTPLEVIANTCRKGFPRLSSRHRGFPSEISQFIAKCTALRPEDRFANATELSKAFEPMVRRLRAQLAPANAAQRKPDAPPRREPDARVGREPDARVGREPDAPQRAAARPVAAVAAAGDAIDADLDEIQSEAESSGNRAVPRGFLTFIGIIIVIVYSTLLWLAGQRHPGVPAAGILAAAAIAVGLVLRRRRLKNQRRRPADPTRA